MTNHAEMPMDDTISIHAAKTHLSRLIARVESGEVITIARGKTPLARLVPVKAKRAFESMRGQISIGPEFFEPCPRTSSNDGANSKRACFSIRMHLSCGSPGT